MAPLSRPPPPPSSIYLPLPQRDNRLKGLLPHNALILPVFLLCLIIFVLLFCFCFVVVGYVVVVVVVAGVVVVPGVVFFVLLSLFYTL